MDGGSFILVAPISLRCNDAWLSGLIKASRVSIDMIEAHGTRPPSAVVAEHAGLDWQPGPGAARELAQSGKFSHSVTALNLNGESSEWAIFAAEFLTAASALPAAERPQFLILCGPEDRAVLRANRLPVSEVWWWAVVDRLDTMIAAARALGAEADPIRVSCITEVCGFDTEFAAALSQAWDGGLSSLMDTVAHASQTQARAQDSPTLTASLRTPPPASLIADWDAGLVNAWGRYHPFVSPIALPPESRAQVLHTRLWRGQLRELMPLIDEERGRLEAWVQRGEITDRAATFPMEIGPLAHMVTSDPAISQRSSRTRRDAAHWLRRARNDLAHRDVLDPADIADGLALLEADRKEAI